MQSLVLIAAYIAGSNKESTDMRLFDVDKTKWRGARQGANTTPGG